MSEEPPRDFEHDLRGLAEQERAAAMAVAARVGAAVTAHDRDGLQGAVDALLRYPDGRIAALEITSVAGEGILQRNALLARDKHRWETQARGTGTSRSQTRGTFPG